MAYRISFSLLNPPDWYSQIRLDYVSFCYQNYLLPPIDQSSLIKWWNTRNASPKLSYSSTTNDIHAEFELDSDYMWFLLLNGQIQSYPQILRSELSTKLSTTPSLLISRVQLLFLCKKLSTVSVIFGCFDILLAGRCRQIAANLAGRISKNLHP